MIQRSKFENRTSSVIIIFANYFLMNTKTRKFFFAAVLLSVVSAAVFAVGQFAMADREDKDDDDRKEILKKQETIPLKESKLIIEHNDTDEDTGFQGFIDSEGWKKITVTGPDGKILKFEGKNDLGKLGLTELFFETVEPENTEVSIEDVLETLPEGEYVFKGSAIEAGEKKGKTLGVAVLTHNIPDGTVLLSPAEDAIVPVDDLVVQWGTVDKTITGDDVNIISYQLIIEKDVPTHPNMIGKMGLSMYLPPSVTEMTIPGEFFEPDTDYNWEVLAIEESGNQTLQSSQFSTEE